MISKFPIGLLSDQDRETAVRLLGGMVNNLGEKIYHIGGGALVGESGWAKFQEAVKKLGDGLGLSAPKGKYIDLRAIRDAGIYTELYNKHNKNQNMENLNSNKFREMYVDMGINIDKLGCIMLDVDGGSIESPSEDDLYFTKNPDRFWIKGFVAGHTPHVTLLYGLMESGNSKWKWEVDKVLEGWEMNSVSIAHVGYFDSPYPDEPYYCIVAHLLITEKLWEGHKRLEFLPHINTFPDYKAHITLCYIKKDEAKRDALIRHYNETLTGKTLPVLQLNYGK